MHCITCILDLQFIL